MQFDNFFHKRPSSKSDAPHAVRNQSQSCKSMCNSYMSIELNIQCISPRASTAITIKKASLNPKLNYLVLGHFEPLQIGKQPSKSEIEQKPTTSNPDYAVSLGIILFKVILTDIIVLITILLLLLLLFRLSFYCFQYFFPEESMKLLLLKGI